MKKIVALFCMIAFVFGMTGCSVTGEAELTQFESEKIEFAKQVAVNQFIPFLNGVVGTEDAAKYTEYTPEEVEYTIGQQQQLNVDGYGFQSALISFESGLEAIGGITEIEGIEGIEAVIDGKEIIVDVDVIGTKKDAVVQFIFSNDMFMVMESAALNPVDTASEAMAKAGMNTLIGMGSVFVILILISLIISSFGLISKLQNGTKKAAPAAKQVPTAASAAAPATQQTGNLISDLELVAVITAAIAASEGATSTDGFVVRSIRKKTF